MAEAKYIRIGQIDRVRRAGRGGRIWARLVRVETLV